MLSYEEVLKIAAAIRLVVFDVDGVLTDGSITFSDEGSEEKTFHVHDGLGLVMARDAGIEIAIMSSRFSDIVTRRMSELGVKHILQDVADKQAALKDLMSQLGIEPEMTAFVGDDLVDLPAMSLAGLSIAVANARPQVKAMADWLTEAAGGNGGARETCELILEATGKLDQQLKKYTE